jgi:uncharacterized protein YkwD
VVVALTLGLATTACFPDTGPPPTDPVIGGIYRAMNADRAAANLPPLTWSPKLANLAGSWSATMAAQQRMFHRDLGSTIYTPEFSRYRTLGENVLAGPGDMTAGAMEVAWMASPPHKANILSTSFNVVGVGVSHGSDGKTYATVNFGGI